MPSRASVLGWLRASDRDGTTRRKLDLSDVDPTPRRSLDAILGGRPKHVAELAVAEHANERKKSDHSECKIGDFPQSVPCQSVFRCLHGSLEQAVRVRYFDN